MFTKPIAGDVSEELLKSWYMPQDIGGYPNEKIIPATHSLEQIVQTVAKNAGLLVRR
jgi:hypothetical protein